jgi:hypothetical protein
VPAEDEGVVDPERGGRALYTAFATTEAVLREAALMLRDAEPNASAEPETLLAVGQLGPALETLLDVAEAIAAPSAVWRALARAENQLTWFQQGLDRSEATSARIQVGLSRSLQADYEEPEFSIWGWDERTEPGRHCYIYARALEYLLDRSMAVPARLSSAMTESLFAWEGDMLELHPIVRASHIVTAQTSSEHLTDDNGHTIPSSDLPACADFDEEDQSVLRNTSVWNEMSPEREQLLTLRMATNYIRESRGPVPTDLVRMLRAAVKDAGAQ